MSGILTEEEVQRQLDAAYKNPRRRRQESGPRARAARYDPSRRHVVLELENGCTLGVPIGMIPDTGTATPEELAKVQVWEDGEVIAWEELDTDSDVGGLILEAFELKSWAPRYLGSLTSPAKAEAARRNGRKGGRPRKQAPGAGG